MSSDKHCCVPGCKESGGMHPVLHQFPNPEKDRSRFNTWLYTIGGDILGLENERIFKYRRVCHSHFEEKYICRNNRISNIAVPSINIPDLLSPSRTKYTIAERKPMQTLNVTKRSDPESDQHHAQTSTVISKKDATKKENIDPTSHHQREQPELMSSKIIEKHLTSHQIIEKSIHQTPDAAVEHDPVNPLITKSVVQQTHDSPVTHEQLTLPNPPVIKRPQQISGIRAVKKTRRTFLTEKERQLYDQIVAAKVKICKIKNKSKRMAAELKAAKKFATNPAALEVMENCSKVAKILIQIQWRESKKKEKGRRFTLQEKIAALSILKQSPKGYRNFRSIFILPSPQTLIKLIQQSNLRPGLNKNIFSQLKKKAEKMKVEERLCILLFDEVSIKANLTYHEKKDKITGFVDDGKKRKPEFADHAQVFMVRGLLKNYKQAVSYTFSASATKGPELATQIKDVVTALQKTGLIVVATICDQGTNNRQAIKLLLNETRGMYLRKEETPKENIILINDHEIVPLYDPPHLLKGIRNNLLNKDLSYEKDGIRKTAKWSHLQRLYDENPGYKGVRLIPKLTESHVDPQKLNKMKVKYASQVFSRTVASNMGYLADKGILPEECKETADLLLFMDNIFDSLNGSYMKNKYAKPLLGPATPNSVHRNTWTEGKQIFKSMKFITTSGKVESVPTVANWVWTLDGIEVLLKKLEVDFNIISVWMRHLNQDPLENFFGSVRSHGCRNNNPTCDQFESAFATLLINNLNTTYNRGKNCEGDFCDALHALIVDENTGSAADTAAESEAAFTCDVDLNDMLNINLIPIEEKNSDPRIIAPLEYMSGYFVKKARSRVFKNCTQCESIFTSNDNIEYIDAREFAGKRWLCTPSKDIIKLISNMQDIVNKILKENLEHPNLKTIITTSMYVLLDFNFITCVKHKKNVIDYLMTIVIRCLIFSHCKNINAILCGKFKTIDDDDHFQIKAKKFYGKCFKRKIK